MTDNIVTAFFFLQSKERNDRSAVFLLLEKVSSQPFPIHIISNISRNIFRIENYYYYYYYIINYYYYICERWKRYKMEGGREARGYNYALPESKCAEWDVACTRRSPLRTPLSQELSIVPCNRADTATTYESCPTDWRTTLSRPPKRSTLTRQCPLQRRGPGRKKEEKGKKEKKNEGRGKKRNERIYKHIKKKKKKKLFRSNPSRLSSTCM